MKTTITKFTATLMAIVLSSFVAFSQQVVTTAPTVSVCPGTTSVQVPITVTNFSGVASISLALGYNTGVLQYVSYTQNSALAGGFLVVNASGGKVLAAWFGLSPVSIASGATLFTFTFNYYGGNSPLVWDMITQGNCQYSDILGDPMPANFENGAVNATTAPSFLLQPVSSTVNSGDPAVFSAQTGSGTYQWQISTNSGGSWSSLTNTSPYSGVTSGTLNISTTESGMDGYVYRCIATSSSCNLSSTSANATLTVSSGCPLPLAFNVTGGGTHCVGTGTASIGLNGSETGVTYSLYVNGSNTGASASGTGSALNFGSFSDGGSYTVQGLNTCGVSDMTGSATITSLPLPLVTLPVLGNFCMDAGIVTISGGSPAGGIYSGTGVSGTSFDPTAQWAGSWPITYTYTDVNGCVNSATNYITTYEVPVVTFLSLPSVCLNSAPLDITSFVSPSGGVFSGVAVVGNLFDPTGLSAGIYPITYEYTSSEGCTATATSAIAIVNPPSTFNVTGGGTFCSGGSGVSIGLSGSETGVSYSLYYGATNILTLSGDGAPIDFGIYSTSGTYTVVAENDILCATSMNGSAEISEIPGATLFDVSGGGSYCIGGSGLEVGLNGSETGFNYGLYHEGIATGLVFPGNGNPVNFGSQTTSGSYSVYAVNSCGSFLMNNSASIVVNPLPASFNVYGGGNFCAGGSGVNVGLDGSETGTTYELFADGITTGNIISGDGNSILFGTYTIAGSYTVLATNSCGNSAMNGSAIVTIDPSPSIFDVTGGGVICAGAGGSGISLSGSEVGITYELFIDGAYSGSYNGTGSVLSLGNFNISGTYTITATNSVSGCTALMNGSANITVNPLPTIYAVTGGGELCPGGAGFAISLDGSETGVGYTMVNEFGTAAGNAVGTGSSIVLNTLSLPGTYTVTASNLTSGCQASMSGNASITNLPAIVIINNPGNVNTNAGTSASFGTDVTIPVSYQWQVSTDGGISYSNLTNVSPYSGVFSNNLNIVNVQVSFDGYMYRCEMTDPNCPQVATTAAATLTVNTLPVIHVYAPVITGALAGVVTIPITAENAFNVAAISLSLNYNASILSYVGYQNPSPLLSSGTMLVNDLSGQIKFAWFSVTPINFASGTLLEFLYNYNGGHSDLAWNSAEPGECQFSDFNAITLAATFTNGSIDGCVFPVVYNVTGGGSACPSSGVSVGLSGSESGVSYTLYNNGISTGNSVNGTNSALSFGSLNTAGNYTVTAVNSTSGCTIGMNSSATITNYPTLSVVSNPSDVSANAGTTVNFNADADMSVSYQWQASSDNGLTFTNVPDAAPYSGVLSNTLTIASVSLSDNGNQFRCVMTEITCNQVVFSNSAILTVNPVYVINTYAPVIIDALPGAVSVPVTIEDAYNVAAISLVLNYDPTILSYTGYQNLDPSLAGGIMFINDLAGQVKFAWLNVIPINISSGTLVEYLFTYNGGHSDLTWNTAVTGDCQYSDFNSATLSANFHNGSIDGCVFPTVFNVTGGGVACAGSDLEVTLSGSETGYDYSLFYNGISNGVSVAGTGSAISFGNYSAAGNYTVTASNSIPGCSIDMNGSASISNFPGLSVVSDPSDVTANVGAAVSFGADANMPVNYQWQISTDDGLTFSNVPNAAPYSGVLSNNLALSPVSTSDNGNQFRCVMTETTCSLVVISNTAALTVNPVYVINTYAPVITDALPGAVTVPVTIEDAYNVAAISLVLNYDPTILSYTGYQNLDPSLAGGIMFINDLAGQVKFAWLNVIPINISSGTLVEYLFTYNGGHSDLTWNTSVAGDCQYSDFNSVTLSANFHDGSIDGCVFPAVFNVTGGGVACAGSDLEVTLSGSETGYNYSLYYNGISIGVSVAGTGSAISFGNYSAAGNYTVVASNSIPGCSIDMNGSASIYNFPGLSVVSDPSDVSAIVGATVSFDADASMPVNYQWQISTDDGLTFSNVPNAAPYSGVLSNSLTISPVSLSDNGNQFRCVMTETTCSQVVISGIASLNVNPGFVINTYAPIITGALPGTVTIPVTIENAYNVAAISLVLNYDPTILSYTGYQNLDPSLAGGIMFVNDLAGQVKFAWLNVIPINISSGTLIEYLFSYNGGHSDLTWNTGTPGDCQYSDFNSITLDANFVNGSIDGGCIPAVVYTVGGGGSYCAGGTGLNINLSSSETDATYELYLNGVATGTILNGGGGTLYFGLQTVPGTYTVYATNLCGTVLMDGAADITTNPFPVAFNVVGGGNYCAGNSGIAIQLDGSETGSTYELFLNGVSTSLTLAGDGSPIDFGLQTSAGNYTIVASNLCGTTSMSGNATISIDPLPAIYSVNGGGSYCFGGIGVYVGLDGSETGTTYELYFDGAPTGNILSGDGNALSFGLQTLAGTYSVIASNPCSIVSMTGNAVVTIDPLPVVYNVTGGGSYCYGGTGIAVGLDGSDATSAYELYHNGLSTDNIVSGNGNPIGFGLQTAAGGYTVVATNSCGTSSMNSSATIIVNPLPVAFNVTGGGNYCSGGAGIAIQLDGSETGSTYELFLNGISTSLTMAGDGAPIDFGLQTSAGNYTIAGSNSCGTTSMNGDATIVIDPLPSIYSVNGGGHYCFGGIGVNVGLNSSETGTTYELYFDGAATGTILSGSGNALNFGLQTLAGTYTVSATNPCSTIIMTGNAVVAIDPLPGVFSLTGGGSYCAGSAGLLVGLDGSDADATYELFYNGVTTGIVLPGNGNPINYGLQIAGGVYTAVAINSCGTTSMNGTATIVVNPLPFVYNVTGGGNYCSGGSGLSVGLNNSEIGTSYQLYFNGIASSNILSGNGSSLTFGLNSEAGVYTVVGTNGCGSLSMNGSASISIDPLPVVYSVTGGGNYCYGGSGLSVGLSNSEITSDYTLYYNGVATTSVITGTGSTITFGLQAAAGTYTVIATNPCGSVSMASNASISIDPLPVIYNVTGGGSYCFGGTGNAVGLDGSEIGTTYQLSVGGVATGTSLSGTGSALSFGLQTSAGFYTVTATNPCATLTMNGSSSISINPLPGIFAVTGGGSYCVGGTGLSIGLSGSETGSSYELFFNGVSTSIILSGNGNSLDFGLFTSAGTYSVQSTNSCGIASMAGSSTISINPLPGVYSVTGGGSYCVGGSGVNIGLSGSESNATYQLSVNGVTIGSSIAGNGSSISFGLQTIAGNYTVVSTNSCGILSMTGSATVVINPTPVVYNVTGGGSYCPGSAGLAIGLDGSEAGVTYTLYYNGTATSFVLTGAGSSLNFGIHTLTGTYTVMASGSCGSLLMAGAASISLNPNPVAFNVTGGGTYTAGTGGIAIGLAGSETGVTYTLMLNGVATTSIGGNGLAISFGNQTEPGLYTVSAVSSFGCSSMMLGGANVIVIPIVVTDPTSVSIFVGYDAVFSVTALGATIYQWQVSVDGGATFTDVSNGPNFAGANTNTLYISGAPLSWTGYLFQCVVSNPASQFVYSNSATLVVLTVSSLITIAPTMTATPNTAVVVPINVLNFNNVGAISWTLNYDPAVITYTGYQNTDPQLAPGMMFNVNTVAGQLFLQWFSMTPANIGNGVVLDLLFNYHTGCTPLIWQSSPAEASQYGNMLGNPIPAVWVNGSICSSSSLVISAQPVNAEICEGGSVSYNVTAAGATTYQWIMTSDFGVTWNNLVNSPIYSGVNTSTLTVNGVVNTMTNYLFACSINTGLANTALTNAASVSLVPYVTAYASVVANPGSTICPGTLTTFSLSSLYNFSTSSFIWYVNGIPVGFSSTYSTTGLADGDVVDCDVIDPSNCVIAVVTPLNMIVDPHPVIVTNPVDVTGVAGDVVSFSVTATGGVSYQWQESTDGGFTFVNLSNTPPYAGATSSTLTISGLSLLMDQNKYRCIVTEGICGNTATSNSATLNVFPAPIITYLPNVANCTGYQVIVPMTVDNFINAASASLKFSYDPTVLTYTGYQNVNPALSSNPFNLIGISELNGQISLFWFSLTPVTLVNGSSLVEFVFNYASPGTTAFTWDPSYGNTMYTNMSGTVMPSTFINGSATSYALPVAYAVTGGGEYCIGSGGLPVGVAVSQVGVNYELFLGGISTGIIVSGTGSSISFGNQIPAGSYTVVGTNASTSCFKSMIGSVNIIINPLPIVSWTNTLDILCTSELTYVLTGGTPAGGTYSGSGVSNNLFNAAIAGPGIHTLTYTYTDANACVNSATNTISVLGGPTPYPVTGGGSYCQNGTGVSVGLTDSDPSIVYQLFINGINSGSPIFGTGNVLDFGLQTIPGVYTIVGLNIFNNCTQLMIGSATVSVIVPSVSWTNSIPAQCENNASLTLTGGTPAGGTYTGSGVTNNVFSSVLAGVGVHLITYTYTDGNGCTGTATNLITVNPIPTVTFAPLPNVCSSGASISLVSYASPVGGIFSGTGVEGNTFSPAISGAGTFTITYTFTNSYGCSASTNRTITVDGGIATTWTNVLTQQCITSTAYFLSGGTPAGGVYSGTGVTGNIFNASLAGAGMHTLTYTYTGVNGCLSSATNTIIVNALPVVTWSSALPNQCVSNSTYALAGAIPAGGTYSGAGVSGSNFSGAMAGVGIHTLTYTYTDINGCTNSITNSITVVSNPVVSFAQISDVCANSPSIALTPYVTPLGGVFSGTGVSGNTFNPGAAGTYVITYTYSANGCTSSVDRSVVVMPIPSVTWTNSLTSQCVTSDSYLLSGGVPAGGVYSGTGVNGGVFNASVAGSGIHTLTYTFTGANGCTNFATNTIIVNSLPTVSWTTALATQCVSVTTYTLAGATPAGGIYSGTGVIGNNFSPNLAGVGVHILTYTYTDGNGCVNSTTNTISVVPVPVVNFAPIADVCANAGSILLTSYVTPIGGVFSGTGVSGNTFTTAAAGVYVITYTYTANACSVSVDRNITVLPVPTVSWTNSLTAQCITSTAYFLSGGTPAGGVYSGTGVTGNVFNASIAGAGTYTLTYTYSDANACVASATNTITVNSLPVVVWSTILPTQCVSATTYALAGATPVGGVFSGSGVIGNNFNPNLAGVGVHIITYTFTDGNGCVNSTTNTISVVPVPVVNFAPIADVCANAGSILLTSYVTPIGGVFSGTGVSGNTFTTAAAGVYVITYTYTANGCSVSVDRNITVLAVPTVSWTNGLTAQCVTSTAYFLGGGTPAGGVYSGTGVTGNVFNASIAGAGTYTLTYTYSDANACVASATNTITVNSLPVVAWSTALPNQCLSATTYALTGATPINGIYSGAGVSGSNFNANLAGVGIHTITYTYTDANGCENSTTNSITVVPVPVVNFAPIADVCANAGSILLSSYVTPIGGVFSGTGVSGNTFTMTTPGVYVITYTYTANGCPVSVDRNITVLSVPTVSWSNSLSAQCITSTAYFLSGGTPAGGVYSGTGVNGNVFNASIAGAGTYTLTYTYSDANACVASATNTITVNSLPVVAWSTVLPNQCLSATTYALTGATPINGIYSGAGVSGSNFNANLAGVGIHTITYTYTDANGCENSTTNTITVVPVPVVNFAPIADVCANAGSILLSSYVTPIGGAFSGTGVSGNTFTMTTPGVYVITYTYTANGCPVSVDRNITVLSVPTVSWSNSLSAQCITSTAYFLSGGTPAGGVYSGTGVNGNVFNASIAGAGTYTLTYTYSDANACVSSATNTITVNSLPVVTWSTVLPDQCLSATTYALTGATPINGIYSGAGVSGSNFNANLAGVGIHTITYTYTDANGCENSTINTITVAPVPVVSFAPIADVCANAGGILLTSYVTPIGGAFTGTGVSGNTFTMTTPGVYVITYTYTANGCSVSVGRNITVLSVPTVSWTNGLTAQCVTSTAYFLSGGTPAGGVYSGTGVNGNVFNASIAGAGIYTLTYTYSDANGCEASATNTITVHALPVVSWSAALSNQCISATTYVLSGGLPGGGTYSGAGVSGTNFNASILSAGTYVLTYTYTDVNGCTSSTTNTITVTPLPVISFSALPAVCSNNGLVSLISYASPVGGTFTGTGITGNSFDPAIAGTGTYTITYTFTDGNGCSSSATRTINVLSAPVVTWTSSLGPLCASSTSYFLSGGLPSGGVYSGAGVTGNIFNASLAGAGTHTITYTYTNASGCIGTAVNTIVVNALPVVTWSSALADQCESSTLYPLSGALPTGGVYSGSGVSGSNFNANLAGLGIHTITYTVTDVNGCINSITNTITVTPVPVVSFSQLPNVCVNEGSLLLSTYVIPNGGVFAGAGVIGNLFNPAVAGVGAHTITYTVTSGGCSVSVIRTILVNAAPIVTWPNSLTSQCVTSASYFLGGATPNGGVYSGAGVTANIFNAALAGVGPHTLTYTYTDGNGCTASTTNTIVVFNVPIVTWPTVMSSQCVSVTSYTLSGGLPTGGTYSGTGVSGSNFNPALAGVGIHIITYSYNDLNGCSNSITNTISVLPAPTANLLPLPTVCQNASAVVLTSFGYPVGGVFSGTGVAGNNFNPSVSGVGTFVITYTVSNSYGCSASTTSNITVNAAPVVTWPGILSGLCANSTELALTGGLPINGTYSGPGVVNNKFYPSISGTGTFTLTYTFVNSSGCFATATNTITVNPLPIVFWPSSLVAQCVNSTTYGLSGGVPSGGVYTGPGVSGSNFNASLAGVGAHILTYTYTTAGGCVGTATNVIIVNPLPSVGFPGTLPALCVNSTTFTLNTGFPSGGTYSGAGVTGNNFNASVAGVGTHTITYTYTNGNGCTNSATNSITVNSLPVVTWPGSLTTQCANYTSFALSGGIPAGGTYTGPGVVLNNFNAALVGAGTYTLTYTYTNPNGCINSATNTITVSALPTVSLGPDVNICFGTTTTLTAVAAPAGVSYLWSQGSTTSTISVYVGDTTIYCVTVTNAAGCTAVDCIQVNALHLPVANAGFDQTICAGEIPVSLNGSGTSVNGAITAYAWSSGAATASTLVSPTDTTWYILTVTDVKGCKGLDSVRINVNIIPTVTLGPDITICENMRVTLVPVSQVPGQAPYDNYLWSTGFENDTLIADSTGYGLNNPTTISVTVTLNGCQQHDEVIVTWVPCPGIPEIDMQEVISVYPNPTEGSFTVTIENVDNAQTFDVYNNVGQQLISEKLTNNGYSKFSKQYDLSNYPTGIYYLRFTDGNKVRTRKLIIK